jgi:hypothetical protein
VIKRAILSATFSFAAAMVWAGCVSDCKDEFDSAIRICKLLWDAPKDSDDLEMCIDSAKSQYESCIEDCKD